MKRSFGLIYASGYSECELRNNKTERGGRWLRANTIPILMLLGAE